MYAIKLVVGLGNPGLEYHATRHNAGARAVRAFAEEQGWVFKADRSSKSLIARGSLEGREVLCALPQTFMNLSGEAVAALKGKKKIRCEDILVVYDDVDLPLGLLRFKKQGSDAGHRGLESLIGRLETRGFARLRIGIGPKEESEDLSDFVLSRFRRDETVRAAEALNNAAQAIETWVLTGIDRSMNLFNKKRVERGAAGV